MAVDARGGAVGGPTGVSNACVRIEDLVHVHAGLRDELLEGSDLANLFDGEDLILLVTVHGESSRVVSTVL
jgi:hypothetical protein